MKLYYFLFSVFVLSFSTGVIAQNNMYLTAEDSDKEAINILTKSKEVLNKSETLFFDFTFSTKYAGQIPDEQSGILKQKGDMYYLEFGDRTIYCDGKDVRVYQRTQNILEINDLSEESGMVSPKALLDLYESADFVFVLGDNLKLKGKVLNTLMLKPIDKESEFSKINILIDSKSYLPYEIAIMYKDGLKNNIKINEILLNQKIQNSVFKFNEAEHPGVSVEDLRMN